MRYRYGRGGYEEQHYPDMLHETVEWRGLFAEKALADAQKLVSDDVVREERNYYYGHVFTFLRIRGRIRTTIYGEPHDLGDTWDGIRMECTCGVSRCVHLAASLLFWEKSHGPWVVWEDEYKYKQRKEKEEILEQRKQRKADAERAGLEPVSAVRAFQDRRMDNVVLFDMEKLVSAYTTTPAAIARIGEVLKEGRSYGSFAEIRTNRQGAKHIVFQQTFDDPIEAELVWGTANQERLLIYRVRREKDGRYFISFYEDDVQDVTPDEGPLDEYELAALSLVWDQVEKESSRNVTDDIAEKFFSNIRRMRESSSIKEIRTVDTASKKEENVTLLPRVVIENGEAMLSFKIGAGDSRKYILKSCYDLIEAVKAGKTLPLGKREAIAFATQTFDERSARVYDFIQRHREQSYGGVYQIPLKGAALDNFYDMDEGGSIELLDKTNKIKDKLIPVGHVDIRFALSSDRLSDARGGFLGIVVSGFVPVMIKGNSYRYVLDPNALSRISKEEMNVLAPFLEVADAAGYFRFQVGTDRLQEFYYRVLPGLLENPFVSFTDHCEQEAAAVLPPEPAFTFLLDLTEDELQLKALVNYDEVQYTLSPEQSPAPDTASGTPGRGRGRNLAVRAGRGSAAGAGNDLTADSVSGKESHPVAGGYRDEEQETRVRSAVGVWFPDYHTDTQVFCHELDDDYLYDFLTTGLSSIEFYGTVKGSSAFRSRRVLPEPRIQLGISVGAGNLLDIAVTSKGLSPEELLEVYNSYTLKKRFYKLKSGDFIDLTQDDQLGEMGRLLEQIDLVPVEVLREKASIPAYRALYLDRMLEEHEQMASSRDRTYRALIRSFKTIREAEYEIPDCFGEVLREYQAYGYKWLRTLQKAGFGGILADEMGLGKTVQMIALFQADMEEGSAFPSLVVCPASLVYNWQEEISRFAPEIRVQVVAGTLKERKKALADEETNVFITSYDLLRRDIALYEGKMLNNCVLDEAQYIKNARSAVAKTVKALHARNRFALTGTPIENRLAELWSIFDYLMPGFLYPYPEFERRFESPIAKHHEETATEKLKLMTGPFILRRRKEEVLKDLPPSLEEVRYVRLSGEQQRLYDAQVLRMKGMLTEEAAASQGAGREKIRIFAELTRIRQICCDPSLIMEGYQGESAKREACVELIKNAIEEGHRMLVFSQFVTMLELLEEDLKAEGIEYYKIVGSTPKDKRISQVHSFNEGTVPVFLISLKAGGTGLNLTGADVVIHYDPWWNLAAQNQATDRAHRIGQTRQVTVFKLILKNTIEERILQLQDAKKDLAETILEGSSTSIMSLSTQELLSLLE